MPSITVIMPTYNQAAYICRAIDSLLSQSEEDWELLIIDDGSPDETYALVARYSADTRILYRRLEHNSGMGAALNVGLDLARGRFVAYLPSDDVYYPEHLASLLRVLADGQKAVLAYAGVRHHYNRVSEGLIPGFPLQPVQVMHRQSTKRWLEREELVTDDMERMYWHKLRQDGEFTGTGQITCEWVDHPDQRHKLLREPTGGINPYRVHFGVKHPLRFHTTTGNYIDEVELYRRFRERPDTPFAPDGLKILLIGELAYNPERVLALEEAGHKLYGLWMQKPYWYNYVGPLPFGHVEDIPNENWQEHVELIRPDVIYALLNWQAVVFAHEVLRRNPGIPFVWHFKEGPFICLEKGTWPLLVDLYRQSDGQIYCSPEMRDWCETAIPGSVSEGLPFVLDGDLPKSDWFDVKPSRRLSLDDGEIHTVVPGRPIGLHPPDVADLAKQGVHLHFYGDFTHGQWLEWIEKTRRLAPRHMHLHNNVDQRDWVEEFSKYDAGWLHYFKSDNSGDIRRSNWDDLNYPARLSTLMAAGLPMLQYNNQDALVATQSLASRLSVGLFITSMAELSTQLADDVRMDQLRSNAWQKRDQFTFDYHVQALVEYFRKVIDHQRRKKKLAFKINAINGVELGTNVR